MASAEKILTETAGEPSESVAPAGQLKSGMSDFNSEGKGAEAYAIVEALYPICRSITGDGVRESLRLLQQTVPLQINEVASGTQVFDWIVPDEWNIRDAYIKNAAGERVVDFHQSNLHVLNYSTPVHGTMSLAQLTPHLFSLPESPDWIPYRTSYFKKNWGFCPSQRQLDQMPEGQYDVCIDSSLEPGHLTYGEFRIQGKTDHEVLISAHVCHPSLCNDNLSAVAVAAVLAQFLDGAALHYSYRFVWAPGTIGAITWLALHEQLLPRIKHGLVLSCLGDSGPFTYKRSRQGNADIDRAVDYVLESTDEKFELLDFTPYGYDERQYCSPGINLPVGCLMRTPNGKYPEYHTSADNLDFISAQGLGDSVSRLLRIVEVLESDRKYLNLNSKCEPQLGRRGLYRQTGGTDNSRFEAALMWMLNLSDGEHSVLDIARRSQLECVELAEAAEILVQHDLLCPLDLNGESSCH